MYWCYQCARALRIISYPSTDVFCPRCFGRFLHEIDAPPRPATFPPPPHFLPHPFHPQHQYDGHPRRWVIYGGEPATVPGRAFRQPAPAPSPAPAPPRRRVPSPPPPVPRRPSTPPAFDPGNYFTGPNLNNLIDELTRTTARVLRRRRRRPSTLSRRCGSPGRTCPTARSAPCARRTSSSGRRRGSCRASTSTTPTASCRGSALHNSCPVCRYKLPGGASSNGSGGNRNRERERAGPLISGF